MSARSVLLTGGSRGIGAAIAERLAADGWQVIAPSRAELDLASADSLAAYLASGAASGVDGLVLNAGINELAEFGQITDEAFERMLQVNLESNFTLLRAIAPRMAQRGFGRIVGVTSLYAGRARGARGAYSVTKAGLEALLRSVTVEYAGRGVLANAVAPGFVDTELTRKNNSAEVIAALLERVPVGRLASVAEVADAVAFLMSERNTYITGQVLAVDGGWQVT